MSAELAVFWWFAWVVAAGIILAFVVMVIAANLDRLARRAWRHIRGGKP